MVVDVGQWYTHKRQLQNRADAAAFAAGIEYAKNWKACVQTGDSTLKAKPRADRERGTTVSPPTPRQPTTPPTPVSFPRRSTTTNIARQDAVKRTTS